MHSVLRFLCCLAKRASMKQPPTNCSMSLKASNIFHQCCWCSGAHSSQGNASNWLLFVPGPYQCITFMDNSELINQGVEGGREGGMGFFAFSLLLSCSLSFSFRTRLLSQCSAFWRQIEVDSQKW